MYDIQTINTLKQAVIDAEDKNPPMKALLDYIRDNAETNGPPITSDQLKTMFRDREALAAYVADPSLVPNEIVPVVIVRALLTIEKVSFNPAKVGDGWDAFSDRYKDAILYA